jgi:hypothetical protein
MRWLLRATRPSRCLTAARPRYPAAPQDMVTCDPASPKPGDCAPPLVCYVFMMSFVLIVSIVMLNLFTGECTAAARLAAWQRPRPPCVRSARRPGCRQQPCRSVACRSRSTR